MNAPEHRIPDITWQRNDYSRVPFRVHHDEEIYALEMERIFRGPTWSYLCLEAEIPNPGDFRTTWVGDTPVIVTRDKQAGLNAFVNRCSHKGAMISRHLKGNSDRLVCLYHRWTYNHKGELTGLPFRQGLKGEGGMPKDFDMKAVSPRKLKVQSLGGMIFGTFQPDKAEPLEQYLGEFGTGLIKRFFHKPVKILGYSRQKIAGNWKLYAENLRDTYHASLLHEFFVTYGVDRATQKGGVKMDARHRHNMNHAYAASDSDEDAKAAYADTAARLDRMKLRDMKLLHFNNEFADGMNLAAPTFFPNALLIQINNSLGTRQIRPKGVDAHEVFQTLFCYADDDEATVRHRLLSANLVGPAGLVSMEDGEAIEVVQKATRSAQDSTAVIEMGGLGEVKDLAHRVTETPIRGFWSYWAELMGVEARRHQMSASPKPSAETRVPGAATDIRVAIMALTALMAEYAMLIDEDKLEDWVELFDEACDYRIVTRENIDQGLPNVLMWCDNKNMLRDRVESYRNVNEYNPHYDRHILGPLRITGFEGNLWHFDVSYSLFQTTLEGESRLFSVGRYSVEARMDTGSAKLTKVAVVADTGLVPSLLATPI